MADDSESTGRKKYVRDLPPLGIDESEANPAEYAESSLGQVFRVKRTQIEMMKDRNYKLLSGIDNDPLFEEELGKSPEQMIRQILLFREIVVNEMSEDKHFLEVLNSRYEGTATDGKLNVINIDYPIPKLKTSSSGISDFSLNSAKKVIETYGRESMDSRAHVIIISETKIQKNAVKEFNKNPNISIEFFTFNFLKTNPSRHFLVPTHTLLSLEEKNNIIRKNKVDERRYQTISIYDPQSRYHGASVGDIFQIDRDEISYPALIPTYSIYRIVRLIDLLLPDVSNSKL